jgi:DNA-binding CsgD family transcriptional regulator
MKGAQLRVCLEAVEDAPHVSHAMAHAKGPHRVDIAHTAGRFTQALHEQVRDHLTLAREYAALREPYLAATRSQLSEEAWEAAFAEGQAMGFEEAVEYALSVEERPPPTFVPNPEQPATESLTPREREVALLVGRGLTNRQIAQELVLSEHTVITHVRNILKKLNLRSRTQLTLWVTERQSHL